MTFDYMTSLVEERDALRTEVELIRDANENWKIQYDVLQRKLDIAVEALGKICGSQDSALNLSRIAVSAIAEIERLK